MAYIGYWLQILVRLYPMTGIVHHDRQLLAADIHPVVVYIGYWLQILARLYPMIGIVHHDWPLLAADICPMQ